jgi:hypothetical protein
VVTTGTLRDGTFEVIASAAGRSARAVVQLASPENFDALLAQSGLDAKGERDEPSVVNLATASIGASNAVAQDGTRRRRLTFLSIIGAMTLALGIAALLGARRARHARSAAMEARGRNSDRNLERQARGPQRARAAAAPGGGPPGQAAAQPQQDANPSRGTSKPAGPMFCPSCRREFAEELEFCPFDANRLVPVAGHEGMMVGPPGGVCPTCGRGFNPGVHACPHDGDELVPHAVAPAKPPPTRGKICPTCGGHFDGSAAFCGKDGTQLVLLN